MKSSNSGRLTVAYVMGIALAELYGVDVRVNGYKPCEVAWLVIFARNLT